MASIGTEERSEQNQPRTTTTILFEQLILSPKPPGSDKNIQPLIRRQIGMFTQGRIKELYLKAQSIDNTRPPFTPAKPRTASQRNQYAQIATDMDSFGVCAKCLTSDTPIAKIHTNENLRMKTAPSTTSLLSRSFTPDAPMNENATTQTAV